MDIEDQEEKEARDEVNAWRSNFFPCLLVSQNVFLKILFLEGYSVEEIL